MKFCPAIASFLLILFFTGAQDVSARAKQTVWKVPVFFVTDRQDVGVSFGNRRLAEVDTVSALQSGVADVAVPIDSQFALREWQKDGYPLKTATKAEPISIKKFQCQSSKDLTGEFDTKLLAALEQCPRKEVFVFVHGFNNSFEVAAQNAAELSFYTGCPVILYSWPSAARLYRYSVDECNNEWSQEHFNEFIEHLDELKLAHDVKLNVVAHSMGNRLFVRATPIFSGKGIFSDIFMVNPDFDAQTFVHYLARFLPKGGVVAGVRGQLLVSRRDKALSAAEGLFGGYTRLGQGVDFTLSAITRPDLFSKVWKGPPTEAKESTKQLDGRINSIERALRVVDVTALDHGVIGHKVPHEYIASMHFADRPPLGFELTEDKSKGGNKLTSFFARAGKEKFETPLGKFLIVTRCAQPAK
jgi:esterase/lipase superfamily enzyme